MRWKETGLCVLLNEERDAKGAHNQLFISRELRSWVAGCERVIEGKMLR